MCLEQSLMAPNPARHYPSHGSGDTTRFDIELGISYPDQGHGPPVLLDGVQNSAGLAFCTESRRRSHHQIEAITYVEMIELIVQCFWVLPERGKNDAKISAPRFEPLTYPGQYFVESKKSRVFDSLQPRVSEHVGKMT